MTPTDKASPLTVRARGVTLRTVSVRRWRVLDATARIIGHIRSENTAEGARYHAERFDAARACLRELGAFWTPEEAIDCLRYLR